MVGQGVGEWPTTREDLRKWLVNGCGQDPQMKETILENLIKNARGGKEFTITEPKTKGGNYSFNLPKDEKTGKRLKIQKKTRLEVLQEIYLYYYGEEYSEKAKHTFDSMWWEFFERLRTYEAKEDGDTGLKSGTYDKDRTEYHRFFDGTAIQKTKLTQCTAALIEDSLLEIIIRKGITKRAFGTMSSNLGRMFKRAKQSGYIKENPYSDVDVAALRKKCKDSAIHEDEERILNDIEIHKLLHVVKESETKDPYKMQNYAIELSLEVGLRVSELSALMFSDVRGDMLIVERAEHEKRIYGGRYDYYIGETKTRRRRAIPLSDDAKRIIEKIKVLSNARDDDFMFRDIKTGSRLTSKSIGSATTRRGEAAEIKKVSIHRIRRTVESKLVASGIPNNVVADWMGHSVMVSETHYQYNQWTNEQQVSALRKAMQGDIKRVI